MPQTAPPSRTPSQMPVIVYTREERQAMEQTIIRLNTETNDPLSTSFINITSQLFRFPFLFPSVLSYLSDDEVLCDLLLVAKAVKHPLKHYSLKQKIAEHQIPTLTGESRFLPVSVVHLKQYYSQENLSFLTSLRSLEGRVNCDPETIRSLPSWLTELYVNIDQLLITNDTFPAHLQLLHIQCVHTNPLPPHCLPISLQSLWLGNYNFSLVPGSLPSSLTSLTFGVNFNCPLRPGMFPDSLISLHLGSCFNQSIEPGSFPSSLKRLHFGNSFDQPIELNVLPSGLEDLIFDGFDQVILPGVIPCSVKHIEFGSSFNRLIDHGVIPLGVQSVKFSYRYDRHLMPGVLPVTLQRLHLSSNVPLVQGLLPDGLQYLHIPAFLDSLLCLDFLPNSLTTLELDYCFNQHLNVGTLPQSLRVITFGHAFNHPLVPGVIPNGVIELTLGVDFAQPLVTGAIPLSVTKLKLSQKGTSMLRIGSIPSSVIDLTLDGMVNEGVVPFSVTRLTLYCNKQPIINNLCASVTHLTFGHNFSDELEDFHESDVSQSANHSTNQPNQQGLVEDDLHFIPQSVTHLELYCPDFYQPVIFPSSLQHVMFLERLHSYLPEMYNAPPSLWRTQRGFSKVVRLPVTHTRRS